MIEKNEQGDVVSISLDQGDFEVIVRNGTKGLVFLGMIFAPGLLGDIPFTKGLFSCREQALDFQFKLHQHFGRFRN